MAEGYTNFDKLLICLALILLITIVWTIMIGVLYKMNEMKYSPKKRIVYEEDDDEVIIKKGKSKKNKLKKASSKLVTYVKIKYYKSNKKLIFVAPKDIELVEGQKVKVRQKDGSVRTAVVVKGNYTREKYKSFEYDTLNIDK